MPARPRIAVLAASLSLVAACAGRSTAAGERVMTIRVENNRPGIPAATVLIDPEVGSREQLGTVEPGQSAQFRFDGAPGNYRLIALLPSGELRSQPFRLFAGSTARWNMATGAVTVAGGS